MLMIPPLQFKTQSVEAVFNTVNTYFLGTGAKVNIEKSEVLLCLGKASDKDLSFNIPITVNTNCVQMLGIYLGPNKYVKKLIGKEK